MLQDLALALAKSGEHAISEEKLLDAIAALEQLDDVGTTHGVRPRLERTLALLAHALRGAVVDLATTRWCRVEVPTVILSILYQAWVSTCMPAKQSEHVHRPRRNRGLHFLRSSPRWTNCGLSQLFFPLFSTRNVKSALGKMAN